MVAGRTVGRRECEWVKDWAESERDVCGVWGLSEEPLHLTGVPGTGRSGPLRQGAPAISVGTPRPMWLGMEPMPFLREGHQRPECTHTNTSTQTGLRHHPNPRREPLAIHNLHGNTMHWQWVAPNHAARSQTCNVTTAQRDLLRCKSLPELPDLVLPTPAL